MSFYSGDEDYGDEITSPETDFIFSEAGGSRGVPRMPAAIDGPSARTAAAHTPTAAAAPSNSGFDRERLRCPGCGAAFGSGCSCRANARAIGRGEAAKCRAEEPWRE